MQGLAWWGSVNMECVRVSGEGARLTRPVSASKSRIFSAVPRPGILASSFDCTQPTRRECEWWFVASPNARAGAVPTHRPQPRCRQTTKRSLQMTAPRKHGGGHHQGRLIHIASITSSNQIRVCRPRQQDGWCDQHQRVRERRKAGVLPATTSHVVLSMS